LCGGGGDRRRASVESRERPKNQGTGTAWVSVEKGGKIAEHLVAEGRGGYGIAVAH